MMNVAEQMHVAAIIQRMKYVELLTGYVYETALTTDPKFTRNITRNDLNGVQSFVQRLRKKTSGQIAQIVLKFVTL